MTMFVSGMWLPVRPSIPCNTIVRCATLGARIVAGRGQLVSLKVCFSVTTITITTTTTNTTIIVVVVDESATALPLSSTASLLDADGPLFRMNFLFEPSIIQFLCDRVKLNPDFEQQLHVVIHQSKIDASAAIAAANAITILVRADVQFNGADLQGVKISGADLSEGQFDSAQFQGADLTGSNLSRSWLRQADRSNAQMEGIRFGEFPYLEMDRKVVSCSYSPDGTTLAAGLEDDGLDVYNTTTWKRVFQVRDVQGVCGVEFSPDSQQTVFGGDDEKVRLLDCASGEEVLVMKGHTDWINSAAFSPCDRQLASASEDISVRLWNSQTGESRIVLKGHMDRIASVKFSPDGRQFASGSLDATIRFWDPKTGNLGLLLQSLLGGVYCLAYSHDGRWIVSGHGNGTLQLWDAISGEPGPVLRGHTKVVSGIAFTLDSQLTASSSHDQTVRLWDSSTGVCISSLTGHITAVYNVAFSPDGIQLASGGNGRRVRLWDMSSISWGVDLKGHHVAHINKVIHSSTDLFLLPINSRNVQQWDPAARKPGPFVFTFAEGTEIGVMKVSPDGNQIAVSATSGLVQLWDRRKDAVGTVLEGHKWAAISILYSPCDRWLFTRDEKSSAHLWDLHYMKQTSHVRADVDVTSFPNVSRAAFSSSGCQIAIYFTKGSVGVFDLPSRKLVKSKNLKREDPEILAYSPNGQHLAIGSGNGSIYLWNIDQSDDELSAKLCGHQRKILYVAFSPCGHWIASGSEDRNVWLWHRLPEGPESWPCVATVHGFFGSVYEIAWSPFIPMEFLTHCIDDSVRIWRVSNDGGKVVVRMLWGHNLKILCAEGLVLENTTGLSPINKKLLIQRGAVNSTLAPMEMS